MKAVYCNYCGKVFPENETRKIKITCLSDKKYGIPPKENDICFECDKRILEANKQREKEHEELQRQIQESQKPKFEINYICTAEL